MRVFISNIVPPLAFTGRTENYPSTSSLDCKVVWLRTQTCPYSTWKKTSGHVWYLPRHGVIKKNPSGKLHVVFDCAAIHYW